MSLTKPRADLVSERLAKPAQSSAFLTIVLVWCSMIVLCSLYATVPLLPLFSAGFHVSLTVAAWTGSGFSLGYIGGCLIWGAFMERFGLKAVLLAGLGLLAAVTPLVGLSGTLAELVLLRGLQGGIAAAYAPAALALVAEMYPARSKLRTLGYISTALLSAGVFGQLIGSSIADRFGWPAIFYALGGAYAISAAALAIGLHRHEASPMRAGGSAVPKRLLAQYRSVLGNRSLYPPFAITLTALFAFVAMYTLLGIRLSGPAFGLSESGLLLVRACGLLGIGCSPLAGKLIPRFGFAGLLRLNLALSACCALALAFAASIAAIVAISIAFVAGIALTTPTLVAYVSRLSPGSSSLAINIYSLILFLGATAGPVAGAFAAEQLGVATGFVGIAAVLSLAFCATLACRKLP